MYKWKLQSEIIKSFSVVIGIYLT